jgi:sarcosine oxidase delta subunit
MNIICPKCKQPKPEEDYHKNAQAVSGRAYHCKKCMKKTSKEYYQRKKLEKIL